MTGRNIMPAPAEPILPVLRPLIPITAAMALGIWIGALRPGHFVPALLLELGLGLQLVRQAGTVRHGRLLPLAFCIVAGYVALQPWLRPELPSRHVVHFVDRGKWEVTGTLGTEVSVENQGRSRFILRAEQLRDSQRSDPVPGPIAGDVAVTVRGAIPDLQLGDRISVTGHLRAIRSFCNPGGFDYVRFMALKGVRVSLSAAPQTVRIHSASSGLRRRLDALRGRAAAAMAVALQRYSADSIAILKALSVGDRRGIGPELQTAFNRSGVAHVLAISGLHVGMVATAAFAMSFWLAARIACLRRRGWVRRAAALFTLFPVGIYGLLSGFSPSTERAVLMTSMFLLSFWVSRRNNWANTLAAAALMMLIVFPPTLFSVSFQLSFAAVCALVLGAAAATTAPPSAQPLRRRLIGRAATLMRMSLLAIAGTLPLVLVYFDQISWLGPLTNLFVVPLAGLVVVPAGVLGIFLLPLSGTLAGLCWKLAATSLEPMIWLVKMIAQWPFSAVTTIIPSLWEMLLYYLLLALLLSWRRYPARLRLTALIVIICLGGADAAYWIYRRFLQTDLRVTVLDVGQGSAHVLELPGGYTALIDGGGYSDNSVFDVGRSVVAPLLRRNKIMSIDLVILSHPNSDHLNGLLYLLDHFSVAWIWSNAEPADSAGYRQWLSAIERQRIPHTPFACLARQTKHHTTIFEVLAPPPDFLQRAASETWRDLNNNSLVVRVSLGEISFLFCGDIMTAAESDLLARHGAAKLRCTVLMVPHHGSRTSSSADFIKAVQASENIVSVGWKNRFGLPHAAVLERLAAAGGRCWRTDLHGAIRIRTDGITYTITTCRRQE